MQQKNNRNNYLLKKYGITNDQYEQLCQKQDNRCAVCKREAKVFKTRLCVDHDHNSGLIRGVLCSYCNRRIIGRHRTPHGEELFKAAYEYLSGPYSGWIVPVKVKKRKSRKKKKCLKIIQTSKK